MSIEDSPIDRTPDLVAKIRALREEAEKKINQFTKVDDYEVRRIVGRQSKPKFEQESSISGAKKKRTRSSPSQGKEEGQP